MTAQDLSYGYIVEYETIPYIIDSTVGDKEVIVTPINHDWRPERASISELNGIEITKPFLLANGFIKKDDSHFEFVSALDYDQETGILKSVSTNERYPKPIRYVHEMQRAFWEIGQKHKEFVFRKEFYKSNIKELVE